MGHLHPALVLEVGHPLGIGGILPCLGVEKGTLPLPPAPAHTSHTWG